ncbi:MAG: response regulator [Candidatus Omnitrophica bacterium]|nr:response regulator [Candidatus Omnitrophota bacterium]
MPKILVVDDEFKIKQLYKQLLLDEGFEVVEAGDSQTAANLLVREEGIRLILLDINMPVVNGSVLYKLIRMFDPAIKVVVTSAYPLEDQKARVVNADDYYDKTQGTQVLLEKVHHALKQEDHHATT